MFHAFFDIDRVMQVPSLAYLYTGITYEQDGFTGECKGIFDERGRLMVVINHNTDLGDAYEWADDPEYPIRFTGYAYRHALNIYPLCSKPLNDRSNRLVGWKVGTHGKSQGAAAISRPVVSFDDIGAIESARIEPVIVVAGHHRDEIARTFPNHRVVFNPDYEQGMSTSVKAGIRALACRDVDGAAIFLVDHPLIDRETIDALVSLAAQATSSCRLMKDAEGIL